MLEHCPEFAQMATAIGTEWGAILERFGLPTGILIFIALLCWKFVVPTLKGWVDAATKRAEMAEAFTRDLVLSSELRNRQLTDAFLKRNEEITKDFKAFSDKILSANDLTTHELQRLANSLERLNR